MTTAPAHITVPWQEGLLGLRRVGQSLRKFPQLWVGSVILLILVFSALLAPRLAPFDPNAIDPMASMQGPSAQHWFGTDKLGRDTLSRAMYGGRISLMVSFVAVTLSLVIGSVLGLISGLMPGRVDNLIMRIMDSMMAFPSLILALAIAFALGPSVLSVIFALGVVRIPAFARVVRAQVLTLSSQEFIVAAKVMGATPPRVARCHIIPNLAAIITVQASLSAGAVIFAEASLGFLGLSVPPPTPTWGGMLQDGYIYLEVNPWLAIIPGLIIFAAVLAFNFLGDGIRDAIDPRRRRNG
jgi:peptide/nickel transport system permease protein